MLLSPNLICLLVCLLLSAYLVLSGSIPFLPRLQEISYLPSCTRVGYWILVLSSFIYISLFFYSVTLSLVDAVLVGERTIIETLTYHNFKIKNELLENLLLQHQTYHSTFLEIAGSSKGSFLQEELSNFEGFDNQIRKLVESEKALAKKTDTWLLEREQMMTRVVNL